MLRSSRASRILTSKGNASPPVWPNSSGRFCQRLPRVSPANAGFLTRQSPPGWPLIAQHSPVRLLGMP